MTCKNPAALPALLLTALAVAVALSGCTKTVAPVAPTPSSGSAGGAAGKETAYPGAPGIPGGNPNAAKPAGK